MTRMMTSAELIRAMRKARQSEAAQAPARVKKTALRAGAGLAALAFAAAASVGAVRLELKENQSFTYPLKNNNKIVVVPDQELAMKTLDGTNEVQMIQADRFCEATLTQVRGGAAYSTVLPSGTRLIGPEYTYLSDVCMSFDEAAKAGRGKVVAELKTSLATTLSYMSRM
jgi:hypothetical protein